MEKNRMERRRLRSRRIRRKLKRGAERPRMCVFFSNQHVYAQLVDDVSGRTLCSASTVEKGLRAKKNKTELAKTVGETIAVRALEAGVKDVMFDRSGYKYGRRLASLADAAREKGLAF